MVSSAVPLTLSPNSLRGTGDWSMEDVYSRHDAMRHVRTCLHSRFIRERIAWGAVNRFLGTIIENAKTNFKSYVIIDQYSECYIHSHNSRKKVAVSDIQRRISIRTICVRDLITHYSLLCFFRHLLDNFFLAKSSTNIHENNALNPP